MNKDNIPEMVVITEDNNSTSADLWFFEEEKWQSKYISTSNPSDNHFLKTLIEESELKVTQPKWQDLNIGDLKFRVSL
ncbi:hypothetical protein [Thalassotalea sp. ND16A]|uniref:hypothetical protein n=1 Tax=Thalassotalea sp. ND16A TaxID=1535422 RepID=UPI00051A129A|nr:hypothetical protein [Thalassotalea sp. ND16A]KGJ92900.1 hypothetical protein ND16A_1559 [Thalassotalea sp. ND16A]